VSRDLFWFLAGMVVALAATMVVMPKLRATGVAATVRSRPALWVGLAALLSITATTIGMYVWIGAPAAIGAGQVVSAAAASSASAAGKAPPGMEVVTARLAARLEAQGGTAEEWRLLAQSYDFLGRPAQAAAARERAQQSSAGATAVPQRFSNRL
jgi:cytochrome c-type biogenesis protein CcmH/NrfG